VAAVLAAEDSEEAASVAEASAAVVQAAVFEMQDIDY
jgi:hypothetical protein